MPVRKQPLSSEFKVACEIYHFEQLGEPVYFKKLVESLKGEMDKEQIERCIDTLFDWSLIKADYGEQTPGKMGRLYYTTNEVKALTEDMYKNWWRGSPLWKSGMNDFP